jgi:hypothetical protein
MKKNTKKVVILAGVAAAGVAFWYFFFGPGAAPAGSSSGAWTNPANAAMVNYIKQWIPANPAPWQVTLINAMPNISQSDLQNLYALIEFWNSGAATYPPALLAWWTTYSASIGAS